jgi:ubiquinone biosynthesis protein
VRVPIDLGPLAPAVVAYLRARPDLVRHFPKWVKPSGPPLDDALDFSAVSTLLAEDLGRELDSVFAWIDPAPLWRGPLGQIHLARTMGGREVAIKVRRPAAAEIVSREQPALTRAMRALAEAAGLGAAEAIELDRGLQHWLASDLDAPGELANLEQLQGRNPRLSAIAMPRPRRDLSGPRTVVFEVLRGVPLHEVIDLLSQKRDTMDASEFDRVDLANNLVWLVLHQMFVVESYASNLAPEVLVALPGDRISLIDFSHVERLDPVIRRNQYRYMAAFRAVDGERLLAAIAELAESPSREASERFAEDFRRRLHQWQRDPEWERARTGRLGDYLAETLNLLREHGLRLQGSALALARTLLAADIVAKQLSEQAGLGGAVPSFLSPQWVLGFLHEVWQERMPSLGFDLIDLLTEGPGNVVRLLSDIADRRLVLRVQAVESDENRLASATRNRLLATAGLFVGVSVIGAALWLSPGAPAFARWLVVGLGVGVMVMFGVLWRRLG